MTEEKEQVQVITLGWPTTYKEAEFECGECLSVLKSHPNACFDSDPDCDDRDERYFVFECPVCEKGDEPNFVKVPWKEFLLDNPDP